MSDIVMSCIPRTGSTLVWQILKHVLPGHDIVRTHPEAWDNDPGACLIATIRNPFDVAASLYRVRISRGGEDVGNKEGLDIVLGRTRLYFSHLHRTLEADPIVLKYEDFYNDHNYIFNKLADAFGIEIPEAEREEISSRYTVEENRKRANALKDFNEMDEEEIHGDHIGTVVPGSWKQTVPYWGHDRVEKTCRPIAREFGYE